MRSERERIKNLLLGAETRFWPELDLLTGRAAEFDEIFFLATLAKKAKVRGLRRPHSLTSPLRVALIGGCGLYPFHELLSFLLETSGIECELFVGEYDNYVSEIMDTDGGLYSFRPQVIILFPSPQRCRYLGSPTDPREIVRNAADSAALQLFELCRKANEHSGAEVILANFQLPAHRDSGAFRTRALASDWNFRKLVNTILGLDPPNCVRICDIEFLANRIGLIAAEDPRAWFESKQPCSPVLLVEICRELASLVRCMRHPSKKVLVLDLDNTLWGGVVADVGMEGVEIGDTSPRGEAFKAFQRYVLILKERGVLLAVCSKNDLELALEPFDKNPEMVLRRGDFTAFFANWDPKPDNLRRIAEELNLGLDSFVFVDDNPAEVEIVRQFTPEVATILLPEDPSSFVGCLRDCRYFDVDRITSEDLQRTSQYRAEAQRKALHSSAADMNTYLESLGMEGRISEFLLADVPRVAQLINKSNQFNLTTRRRTEGEVAALIGNPYYSCFSLRLSDRFGDHGLISIFIGRILGTVMEIDTWVMSCRVLKRGVEEFALNEIVRVCRAQKCERLDGIYLKTAKNGMVSDFYSRMGFTKQSVQDDRGEYYLPLHDYVNRPTRIRGILDPKVAHSGEVV